MVLAASRLWSGTRGGITQSSAYDFFFKLIVHFPFVASLDQWINDKRRTVWFRVDLTQSYWIPELTKRGFKFHHAKEERAMLYRWLPTVETCNMPPYAHTNLGVGAVVLNDQTQEILVVKDKHGISATNWKLPGGYVESKEDIASAVEREVLEETGIVATFKCLLAFRHAHYSAFGCSDIYIISCLVPQTFDIIKCDREITECQWMKVSFNSFSYMISYIILGIFSTIHSY
jgi:8-oxo-dGTP pyrophosphatase MutT (NUDIX family)